MAFPHLKINQNNITFYFTIHVSMYSREKTFRVPTKVLSTFVGW